MMKVNLNFSLLPIVLLLTSTDSGLGQKPWLVWSREEKKLLNETGFGRDTIDFIFDLCKDDLKNFHGHTKKGLMVRRLFSLGGTCFFLPWFQYGGIIQTEPSGLSSTLRLKQ